MALVFHIADTNSCKRGCVGHNSHWCLPVTSLTLPVIFECESIEEAKEGLRTMLKISLRTIRQKAE